MDMVPRESAKLIYVVDDDDAVRESLEVLIEVMGFDVVGFGSGSIFLASGVAERGDCLILDVHMTELDGFDVLRVLQREVTDPPPIIMISGRADPGMHARARELGAVALLEKPIEEKALERAIQGAIERAKLKSS